MTIPSSPALIADLHQLEGSLSASGEWRGGVHVQIELHRGSFRVE